MVSKLAVILFLFTFELRQQTRIVDTFDMIEVNHRYNEWGVETWSQLIMWDWHEKDSKFHVEHWIMMKDAHEKTEEGEKEWEKYRRKVEQEIRTIDLKTEWLSASYYRGDFVGGKFFPIKNWTNRYYEVKYNDGKRDRLIRAKIFRETHTQYDPESRDRQVHKNRRGITKEGQDLLYDALSIEGILKNLRN